MRRGDIDTDVRSVWRYARGLLVGAEHAVSLGEGWTPLLDGEGQPIATYDQSMVVSYAKVFTGWSYTSGFNSNPLGTNWSPADYAPLICYEIYHDESEKILLDNNIAAGGANSCEPDLDALNGLNRNDGLRQLSVQPRVPGDVRPKPRRNSMRDHLKNAADSVAGAIRLIHHGFHALFGFRVDAVQQNVIAQAERDQFIPSGRAFELGFADADHVTQDGDPQLPQERLRDHDLGR